MTMINVRRKCQDVRPSEKGGDVRGGRKKFVSSHLHGGPVARQGMPRRRVGIIQFSNWIREPTLSDPPNGICEFFTTEKTAFA